MLKEEGMAGSAELSVNGLQGLKEKVRKPLHLILFLAVAIMLLE